MKICTIIDDDCSVVRAIEKSVLCTYIVLLALLLLCVLLVLFSLFVTYSPLCGFTTEYLDLIDYNYYTVPSTLHRGAHLGGGGEAKKDD